MNGELSMKALGFLAITLTFFLLSCGESARIWPTKRAIETIRMINERVAFYGIAKPKSWESGSPYVMAEFSAKKALEDIRKLMEESNGILEVRVSGLAALIYTNAATEEEKSSFVALRPKFERLLSDVSVPEMSKLMIGQAQVLLK